ncbi:phosphatase [Bacillus sp. J33]|uniref:phosphatase n=1 Tax=Bacillus sp. J33 TaxID=935836 RepID=UPI000479E392|nr:phosphatase [Bacillus sp. J33]
MWRRNDGFFMSELLLSLSAWLIVAGVFLPLILKAAMDSGEMQQEFDSTQLLYETLQQSVAEGYFPLEKTVKIEKTVYSLFQKEDAGITEVCIKYEDLFHKAKEKCDVLK